MIDQSRPATTKSAHAEPVEALGFTPVPRHYQRHDGWTPDRQTRFIAALADLGSVRAAAHAVNMTPEGAYLLRRHPEAEQFRAAWEAALALGVQRLEDVAMDRALHGVEVPVYCYGKVIGSRRVYNDALLMFMLRNRAPKRFTADSYQNADAATRGQLERLKRDWRKEWEAEQNQRSEADSDATLLSLDARLGQMRQRQLDSMSAPVRAAWEALQTAQQAEADRQEAKHEAAAAQNTARYRLTGPREETP